MKSAFIEDVFCHLGVVLRQWGDCGCVTITVPVNNIIGLFCADDTEGVDSSVGGCEVGVLSWSPRKSACWALTAGQKVTHTGEKNKKL